MMFTPAPLTVQGVFKKLKEIASLQGSAVSSKKKRSNVSVVGSYHFLFSFSSSSIVQSQNKKKDTIKTLLVACRDCEAQYLTRSFQGKLRIGLAEKSVLVALAHAFVKTPNASEKKLPLLLSFFIRSFGSAEFFFFLLLAAILDASKGMSSTLFEEKLEAANAMLRSVYSEMPSYDVIVPVLIQHGIEDLQKHVYLKPGIPINPMLAQPTKGISEVLDRF